MIEIYLLGVAILAPWLWFIGFGDADNQDMKSIMTFTISLLWPMAFVGMVCLGSIALFAAFLMTICEFLGLVEDWE